MKLKIEPEYQEAFKTHNFDLLNPIFIGEYNDYKCKNCNCILIQSSSGNMYFITNETCTALNPSEYADMTCNEILLKSVLK